jgi:FKBP-type peptidyl-prolyl cis-trans isomerase FkpA
MNKTVIGIAAALAVAIGGYLVWMKQNQTPSGEAQQSTQSAAPTTESSAPASAPAGTEKELKIEELKAGTGEEAVSGKSVSVHYTGWLTDGKEFDSSRKSGQPFTFQLGAGQVIPGWDQGVAGMKIGGKRKLTIPSHLAYGEHGAGNVIPPNATLVFEVELLDVK